jgi:crossover junction endodeoxyribonuclease RusA
VYEDRDAREGADFVRYNHDIILYGERKNMLSITARHVVELVKAGDFATASVISAHFGISRQAAKQVLIGAVEMGLLEVVGKGRASRHVLSDDIKKPHAQQAVTGVTCNRDARIIETIILELPWPPSGNTSVRHTKAGRHYKTPAALAYRAKVASLAAGRGFGAGSMRKPLGGPLHVEWDLIAPDYRHRDTDNCRKVSADSLTSAGVWIDDSNRVIKREVFVWHDPDVFYPDGRVAIQIHVLASR